MSAALVPEVSTVAAAVPRSGIREIVNLAAGRDDVVRLEIGEPDFATPAHIIEAGYAQTERANRYTHSAGMPVLREALAERLQRHYGLRVGADDVVVGQGAVQCLDAVFAATVAPGDEVLVPDPAWPNYEMQAILHGARPVHYPLRPEAGFLPDVAEIVSLFTSRTRVLIINSPTNPTGAVFPPETVRTLVEAAANVGIIVVADEVYDELIFDGVHTNAAAISPEHVVSVFSFSKTYAMTGSRVGYLVGPSWLVPTVSALQEPLLSSVSAGSQAAALAALSGPQDLVREMRETYRLRRDHVVDQFAHAGVTVPVPAGAFYLMMPLAAGVDSRQAALDLVDAGVSTAPGTAFGETARSHLRLSLASSLDDLHTGVDRILRWYERTSGGTVR
jgi:aspartate/methionine/tyrosine aminotransferase